MFCGSWPERGCIPSRLSSPRDSETAEFQRFGILKPKRLVSNPSPTGRYACILQVVAEWGCVPSYSNPPTRFRNGHFSTIRDLESETACLQSVPNRENMPVSCGSGPEGDAPSHPRTVRWTWTGGSRAWAVRQAPRRSVGPRTTRPVFDDHGTTAPRGAPAEDPHNTNGADRETPRKGVPRSAPLSVGRAAIRRYPFSCACAAPASPRRPPPAPPQPGPCPARWHRSSRWRRQPWRTSWRPSRTCRPAWSCRTA